MHYYSQLLSKTFNTWELIFRVLGRITENAGKILRKFRIFDENSIEEFMFEKLLLKIELS